MKQLTENVVAQRIKPPSEILLDSNGAVFGRFGKYEVELAAGRLVQFMDSREKYSETSIFSLRIDKVGWLKPFHVRELAAFYLSHAWPVDEMLYGLHGEWVDEHNRYSSPGYLIDTGSGLVVTSLFLERVRAL